MARIAASKLIREHYPTLPSIELRYRERWDLSVIHIDDWVPDFARFKPMNRFIVVSTVDEGKQWIDLFLGKLEATSDSDISSGSGSYPRIAHLDDRRHPPAGVPEADSDSDTT